MFQKRSFEDHLILRNARKSVVFEIRSRKKQMGSCPSVRAFYFVIIKKRIAKASCFSF